MSIRGAPRVRKIKPEPEMFVAPVREWRVVPGFPDYEISNDGRLRRATAGSNTKVGAHIRVKLNLHGYPQYGLTARNGRRFHRNAHRLVALAFLPTAPPGKPDVLHDDDDKLNCIDTNLKWGNDVDNWVDSLRNGHAAVEERHPCRLKPWTRPRGERHSSAKLTEADVRKILTDDRSPKAIAKSYGVDSALIWRIRNGKVWRHITDPAYRELLQSGALADGA